MLQFVSYKRPYFFLMKPLSLIILLKHFPIITKIVIIGLNKGRKYETVVCNNFIQAKIIPVLKIKKLIKYNGVCKIANYLVSFNCFTVY